MSDIQLAGRRLARENAAFVTAIRRRTIAVTLQPVDDFHSMESPLASSTALVTLAAPASHVADSNHATGQKMSHICVVPTPDSMKTKSIADKLANAGWELSSADRPTTNPLFNAVEIVKSAVPFMMPIPIMTDRRPSSDIVLERADEPYAGMLLHWIAMFAAAPGLEATSLRKFIAEVREVSSDKISSAWTRIGPTTAAMHRKQSNDVCKLCDAVMIQWLDSADIRPLYELATRWNLHCLRANDRPDVLEELNLTVDSMLELPEIELIRLDVINRLAAEQQQHLSEFWEFLGDDPVGIDIRQLLKDAIAITDNVPRRVQA